MKYFITIVLFLFFSNAFADASVFGLGVNKATIDDVISQYGKKRIVNGENGDKHIALDVKRIQFKNLESVIATFDKRGILVGIIAEIRNTFEAYPDLQRILNKKYTRVASSKGGANGRVYTKYKEGGTIISLSFHPAEFGPIVLQYIDLDYFKTSSLNKPKSPNNTKSRESQL